MLATIKVLAMTVAMFFGKNTTMQTKMAINSMCEDEKIAQFCFSTATATLFHNKDKAVYVYSHMLKSVKSVFELAATLPIICTQEVTFQSINGGGVIEKASLISSSTRAQFIALANGNKTNYEYVFSGTRYALETSILRSIIN